MVQIALLSVLFSAVFLSCSATWFDLGFGDRSWIDFSPYDISHNHGFYPLAEISHHKEPNHLAPVSTYKPKPTAVHRPHARPSYKPARKPSYKPYRKPVHTSRPKSHYSSRPKPAYKRQPTAVSRPRRKPSHHPNQFRYVPRKAGRSHYYVTQRKSRVLPKGNGNSNGNCDGNCAKNNNGNGNGNKNYGTANGNLNGNCRGNCLGNSNGNFNGNFNKKSNGNGNRNGNCVGNCYHNKLGNHNGNKNTHADGNGNGNGNCVGNCFHLRDGNGNGNKNRRSRGRTCVGNCIAPRPVSNVRLAGPHAFQESRLRCSQAGFTYHVTPGSYCVDVYRVSKNGGISRFSCKADAAFDVDICGCNQWYLVDVYKTCSSGAKELAKQQKRKPRKH